MYKFQSRKKMPLKLARWLSVFVCLATFSFYSYGEVSVVPAPVQVIEQAGHYTLNKHTPIYHNSGSAEEAQYLAEVLAPAMDSRLAVESVASAPGKGVFLELTDVELLLDGKPLGEEGYQLTVAADGVHVRANASAGLFYGVQTLRQLLPVEVFAAGAQHREWTLPFVKIIDQPRFQWRGLHLDVARHFMPVEFVKKYIDLLAMHKMNRFHWHLTEDQGWRIEIKKYPKLTEVGAWRDETLIGHPAHRNGLINWLFPWTEPRQRYDGQRYGGFYTQDEVREVVAYAKRRHIVVVPEIELPGHAQAAVVAYPELASGDEKVKVRTTWGVSHHIYNPEESTIDFLKDVLTEVMELFPSEYIHIGGDEAYKDLWVKNPRVQQLIKERGLKDEHEMQSWFIKQFDVFLAERGRRLIGWDEILEGGLAEGATVMSWRGADGGIAAAKAGHDVVMADNGYTYFDHYQSESDQEPIAICCHLPLEKVYHYNPVPQSLTDEEARHILGAQGQLWTEYMQTPEHVEYMAYPRASALSEVVWLNQSQEERDYQAFLQRMEVHGQRLSLMGVNYRPLN